MPVGRVQSLPPKGTAMTEALIVLPILVAAVIDTTLAILKRAIG